MPVLYTIECTLREPSIVTNEETEQADVPKNEHPPVFLSYRKLRFHTIRNAPRGSHCSGMEECRLRDPPQAENPASQDSLLSYRKLRFHTIINALRGCALGARMCQGTFFFTELTRVPEKRAARAACTKPCRRRWRAAGCASICGRQ